MHDVVDSGLSPVSTLTKLAPRCTECRFVYEVGLIAPDDHSRRAVELGNRLDLSGTSRPELTALNGHLGLAHTLAAVFEVTEDDQHHHRDN